jgi:hypothetical protein
MLRVESQLSGQEKLRGFLVKTLLQNSDNSEKSGNPSNLASFMHQIHSVFKIVNEKAIFWRRFLGKIRGNDANKGELFSLSQQNFSRISVQTLKIHPKWGLLK